MDQAIFKLNETQLTVFPNNKKEATATAGTLSVTYMGSDFAGKDFMGFIQGVVTELNDAVNHGVIGDGDNETPDEFFIKVGPGTMAALYAARFVTPEMLEGARDDRISNVSLDTDDHGILQVDIQVDAETDGAIGMLGTEPLWKVSQVA